MNKVELLKQITKFDNISIEKLSKYSNNTLFSVFSFLGSFIFTLFFLFIIYIFHVTNKIEIIIILVISLIINSIIVFIIKFSVKRKRENDKKYFRIIDTYSFPSGHVSRISVFILPFINLPFIALIFFILAVMVGLSRIVKGYHYFSDCLAGFILGIFCSYLALTFSYLYLDYIKNAIERILVF